MRADEPESVTPAGDRPVLRSDTVDVLGRPELARLWELARRRLGSNGMQVTGVLRLPGVTPSEREAIALVLGRLPSVHSDGSVRVRLAALDERLRTTAAGRGLVDVLASLDRPVAARAGARWEARNAWQDVWTRAREALAAAGLAQAPWVRYWLDALRRGGGLTRLGAPAADTLLSQAVATLATLLDPAAGPEAAPLGPAGADERRLIGRADLAQRITGDAHGLDDGTVLARLVLRGIAGATGEDPAVESDAAARRALWCAAGVVVDEVSSTVLTYGLRPEGDGWRQRALRERAEHAQETHLTLREIRAVAWELPAGTRVAVCENPRVVEEAAAARAASALVCTAGSPSTVVLDLLDRLARGGVRLRYHGDFDWPGIALANRIVRRYRASPWRMSAADYGDAVEARRRSGFPAVRLAGDPVEASWDPELAPLMAALDVTVHEESLLESLLADLVSPD
jgi:uncharacterized protein (TIGR02679 family)